MLGSANFHGGKILTILSGNLNYQIEHHLFPDMPSNRLADVGKKVRALAEEYDLPYNVDSFPVQFLKVQRTLLKLTLPNRFLAAHPHNAPEVRSEKAITEEMEAKLHTGVDAHGLRRGLRPALKMLKQLRPSVAEGTAHLIRAALGKDTNRARPTVKASGSRRQL